MQQQCSWSQQVSSYHDGALPEGQRPAVEAHLRQCPACQADLAHYQRLTQHLRDWAPATLSPEALRRLHARADRAARERGLLRLVERLTTAAAAILIIGLVGLFYRTPANPGAPSVAHGLPATWEQIALAPQSATALADAQTLEPEAALLPEWWIGGGADEER